MVIPQNKVELIEAIKSTYSKLYTGLIDIPKIKTGDIELDGHAKGTRRSIENLVMFGWMRYLSRWRLIEIISESISGNCKNIFSFDVPVRS